MATLPRRAAAAMIDVVILAIPLALVSMVHPTLALLAAVVYGAIFESSARRATPGKRWCCIAATTAAGERLPFIQAFVRNAVKYAAPYFAGVTYGASLAILAAPFVLGDHSRGLHDHAARSRVRREAGHGLSDLAVGLLATIVPVMFVAGVLPLLMNPAYEAAARKEITGAIDSTHPQRMRIAEFHAQNGRMPESLEEAGTQPSPVGLATMTYRPGSMVLELPRKDAKVAPRLVFTVHPNGNAIGWKCRAEGIRKERLPPICRDE